MRVCLLRTSSLGYCTWLPIGIITTHPTTLLMDTAISHIRAADDHHKRVHNIIHIRNLSHGFSVSSLLYNTSLIYYPVTITNVYTPRNLSP